jgi:hypothetical protein
MSTHRPATGTGAAESGAAERPLGDDVRVVTRETVVDGVVRREIGLERRIGD